MTLCGITIISSRSQGIGIKKAKRYKSFECIGYIADSIGIAGLLNIGSNC